MPEVIEVDGIKSVRFLPKARMFSLRDDAHACEAGRCGLCKGEALSVDCYRYIPNRTRTIYDREK